MQIKPNILDDNRIGRLLIKLSIPAFVGMVVMTLYNVIDTIFISYYVGPLGIAGLSIVFPLQFFSTGIGQMTGMGGASQISRLIGSRNIPRAERVLGNAISVTIVTAALISIVGLINPDFWLNLMGASATIHPYAKDYLTIVLCGLVFQTLSMSMGALLIAEGNVRISMNGMIIGAVTNTLLCALFIIGLGMGVKGSALATVLAQIIVVTYYFTYRFSNRSLLKIQLRNLLIEWVILRDILAIGISSLVRTLSGSVTVIIINRALGIYGGDIAISTFGIINRIMMFAIMPGIVIGQGLQPIVGFNYGALRYDLVLKSIRLAIIAATICCSIAFVILFFTPHFVIRIFTADSEIMYLGSYAAKRIFMAVSLVGFMMVGSTVFQALGKATKSFITAAARSALFLIPLALILPRFWQLDGVWLAFPITDTLTFILTLVLFIPEIRRIKKQEVNRGG